MRKKIALSVIVLLLYCFFVKLSPVLAAEDFTSAYNLTYEVKESGKTRVTYNISLTNQTTNYYASEYTLTLPTPRVENVTAFDAQGPLKLNIDKREGETQLHLVFNEKVVGMGKTLNFTLSYETDEIAQKNGRIWEINIPKRSDNPSITDYTVTLKVPSSFGAGAYFSPPPASGLTWARQSLTYGIRAAFGDFQLFNFKLVYHLKNPNLYPVYTEIALPPDTPYQRVSLRKISPEPLNVRLDGDGNWLARFNLKPGQKMDVELFGRAKIFSQKQEDFPALAQNLREYLSPEKYWETQNPKIQELAKKYKTARQIYDFVVSTLTYDYEKAKRGGKRLGAQGVLANPTSAICTEFTDLFVTLARAAGIPAREVDGFAYTTNPLLRPLSRDLDILHAWPEYWDNQRGAWIMVDPTWGKTSGTDYFENLDFNHFAFAIRGRDSEKPIPAGGYKLEGEKTKDVEISFSEEMPKIEEEKWDVEFELPAKISAGFPVEGFLTLKNLSPTAKYTTTLTISASHLTPANPQVSSGIILPYGNEEIPLKFKETTWLANFEETINIAVGNQNFQYRLGIRPFFFKFLPWIGGGLVVVALAIFVARKAWRLPFQR